MVSVMPKRIQRIRTKHTDRSNPAHRAWVRRHHCSVPGCLALDIECAHIRRGTDGGLAIKPSDQWTLSLCSSHHAEQHLLGEASFEKKYSIDMHAIAEKFKVTSPHLKALKSKKPV